MLLPLVLLFIVVPIVEIYVIIQVGQAIGALWTIALLVADSILGSILMRSQGRAAGRRRGGQGGTGLGHALEGGDERAPLGGAERREGAGQALGIEHGVGRDALGAAAGEHEREPPLVARVARAPDEAPACEVLDEHGRRRAREGEVVGDLAERHARCAGRDVVQELALMLAEVAVVAAAQVHPHPAVGGLETLSC